MHILTKQNFTNGKLLPEMVIVLFLIISFFASTEGWNSRIVTGSTSQSSLLRPFKLQNRQEAISTTSLPQKIPWKRFYTGHRVNYERYGKRSGVPNWRLFAEEFSEKLIVDPNNQQHDIPSSPTRKIMIKRTVGNLVDTQEKLQKDSDSSSKLVVMRKGSENEQITRITHSIESSAQSNSPCSLNGLTELIDIMKNQQILLNMKDFNSVCYIIRYLQPFDPLTKTLVEVLADRLDGYCSYNGEYSDESMTMTSFRADFLNVALRNLDMHDHSTQHLIKAVAKLWLTKNHQFNETEGNAWIGEAYATLPWLGQPMTSSCSKDFVDTILYTLENSKFEVTDGLSFMKCLSGLKNWNPNRTGSENLIEALAKKLSLKEMTNIERIFELSLCKAFHGMRFHCGASAFPTKYDVYHESKQRVVEAFTNLLHQRNFILAVKDMSYMIAGLSSFAGHIVTTKALVKAIVPMVQRCDEEWDGDSIVRACGGLQRLDGNDIHTHNLVRSLIQKIKPSYPATELFQNGDSVANVVLGLMNLDKDEESTVELAAIVLDKLKSRLSSTTAPPLLFSFDDLLKCMLGVHALSNSTHPVIQELYDSVSNIIDTNLAFAVRPFSVPSSIKKLPHSQVPAITLVKIYEKLHDIVMNSSYHWSGNVLAECLAILRKPTHLGVIGDMNAPDESVKQHVRLVTQMMKQSPEAKFSDSQALLSIFSQFSLLDKYDNSTNALVEALTTILSRSSLKIVQGGVVGRLLSYVGRLNGKHANTQRLIEVLVSKIAEASVTFDRIDITASTFMLQYLNSSDFASQQLMNLLSSQITKGDTVMLNSDETLKCLCGLHHGLNSHEIGYGSYKAMIDAVASRIPSNFSEVTQIEDVNKQQTMTHSAICRAMRVFRYLERDDPTTKVIANAMVHIVKQARTDVSFTSEELGDIFLGISRLNGNDDTTKALVDAFIPRIQRCSTQFNDATSVMRILWALHALNGNDPTTVRLLRILPEKIQSAHQLSIFGSYIGHAVRSLDKLDHRRSTTKALVTALADKIKIVPKATMTLNSVASALQGIAALEYTDVSANKLIESVLEAIIEAEIDTDPLKCDHSTIGLALKGLSSLDGTDAKVIKVIEKLTVLLEQSPVTLLPADISNALFGLQGLDGREESTQRLLKILVKKIHISESQIAEGKIKMKSSEKDIYDMNGPRFAKACMGLKNLDGRDQITKELVQYLTRCLDPAKSSNSPIVLDHATNIVSVCNSLTNLDGFDSSTKKFIRVLTKSISQITLSSEQAGLFYRLHGLEWAKKLDWKDQITKEFANTLIRKLEELLLHADLGAIDVCNKLIEELNLAMVVQSALPPKVEIDEGKDEIGQQGQAKSTKTISTRHSLLKKKK